MLHNDPRLYSTNETPNESWIGDISKNKYYKILKYYKYSKNKMLPTRTEAAFWYHRSNKEQICCVAVVSLKRRAVMREGGGSALTDDIRLQGFGHQASCHL